MATALRRVSPIPTRLTPGRLSRATSLQFITVLYAVQGGGGGEFASQYAIPATSTRRYSEAHPNIRSKLLSSSDSTPSYPSAPESFYATHMTSSSYKSICTVSRTVSHLLKTEHQGSPTWGILVSGCFTRRTSATDRLVFVQMSHGKRHPTPLQAVNLWTAWHSFPDRTVSWNFRPCPSSSPSSLATLPSLANPLAYVSPTNSV